MPSFSRAARRRLLTAALAAATVTSVAGVADAATFSRDGNVLVYTAAPGLNNWVHVGASADAGTLRVSDGADELRPGAGCVLVDPSDPTEADCPMPAALRIQLGDGDDRDMLRESLSAIPIEVDGGLGNDTLSANDDVDNHVTLDGGEGDDGLDGMRFADRLLGGPGNDTLRGNGANDTLTGNDGAETIDGGPGDDRLEGGYNHDTITGGPGKDTIYGDETAQRCSFLADCVVVPYGNDTIHARDGERDVIDCGVGNDTAVVDAIDVVSNCETVDAPGGAKPSCKVPGSSRG